LASAEVSIHGLTHVPSFSRLQSPASHDPIALVPHTPLAPPSIFLSPNVLPSISAPPTVPLVALDTPVSQEIKLAPWDLDFAADLQEDSSAQEELEVFPPEDLAHGNIHEEHSVRFCDTNETIDHISEHGDFQFRRPEDSTPRDFELSFEQNITEPLIAAESVKS
jgi:hypothetical protein